MKISKIEKNLIALGDNEKYNTYHCAEHGIYQKRKDVDDKKCIYCKKENEVVENIDELKEKYRKELGY